MMAIDQVVYCPLVQVVGHVRSVGQGAGSLARQHRDGVRSAGALVLLTSPVQREEALVRGGQVYERFALKATQLGIAHQPISAPIEASACACRMSA